MKNEKEIRKKAREEERKRVLGIVDEEIEETCLDFHDLNKGQPWTPCGACGIPRNDKPKMTKEILIHNETLEKIKQRIGE